MKEHQIRSKRLKIIFVIFAILMAIATIIGINQNEIGILIISGSGFIYSFFYIIPQIILNKPLIIISQRGIDVKSKRIHCEYKDIYSIDIYGKNNKQILTIAYSFNNKIIKRTLNNIYDIKLEKIEEILIKNMNISKEQNDFTVLENYNKFKRNNNYKEQKILNWSLPLYTLILWIISVIGFNDYLPSFTTYVAIGFVFLGFVASYIIQRVKWDFNKAIYIHFALMLGSSIYFIYYIVLIF